MIFAKNVKANKMRKARKALIAAPVQLYKVFTAVVGIHVLRIVLVKKFTACVRPNKIVVVPIFLGYVIVMTILASLFFVFFHNFLLTVNSIIYNNYNTLPNKSQRIILCTVNTLIKI